MPSALLLQTLLLAFGTPFANHGVAATQSGAGARALSPLGGSVPLRIMPLGASITWGYLSSDGNGYRQALRSQLQASHGNAVNMVGSQQHGSMADNDVEGWPGLVIDEVAAKASAAVPRYKPNVVLVNCGTNDAVRQLDVPGAGARMGRMLAGLYRDSPHAAVVLSTLLANRNNATEAAVVAINAQLVALATRLRRAGKHITLVGMHDTADGAALAPAHGSADFADETHPNDQGYRKMADLWYEGIVRLSKNGWLRAPEYVAGLQDDAG